MLPSRAADMDLTPPELTYVPRSAEATSVIGDHVYDFYRCQKCRQVVTQTQMIVGLQNSSGITICPCGGLKFSPTNLMWREYLEPRVIQYARNKGASDAALRADLREDMALSSYGWLWQWVFTCRLALIQIFTV